jgi:hypothetical protein
MRKLLIAIAVSALAMVGSPKAGGYSPLRQRRANARRDRQGTGKRNNSDLEKIGGKW